MKYARIEELRSQHPVAAMCRILAVSESGYHAWRQRPLSARTQENRRLETEIKAAHRRWFGTPELLGVVIVGDVAIA